jgi:hypothetical protein
VNEGVRGIPPDPSFLGCCPTTRPGPLRFPFRGPSAGMLPQTRRDFVRDPGRTPGHLRGTAGAVRTYLPRTAHLPSRRTHLPRPHTCPPEGHTCPVPQAVSPRRAGASGPNGVLGRDDVAGGPSAPLRDAARCQGAVSPPLAHPEGVACTPEGCGGPRLAASRRIPEGGERGVGS